MVGDIHDDVLAALRGSRIARRDEELVAQRRGRNRPGEGMLASARTDQRNLHRRLHGAGRNRSRRNSRPAPRRQRFCWAGPAAMVRPWTTNRSQLPAMRPNGRVSDLSGALKRTIEDAFGFVRVRGEISGYRGPVSSGHVYFSLKDTNAKIDAVIWKGVFGRLKTRPQEGLEVIATGKITTFAGKSSYQIVIDTLELAGAGALMALLEERRKRLAAEGLVRRGAQAAHPLSALGHRRRHLADRRRHPRHPAPPGGPLPAPRRGLAGARAGRDQRGRGRQRHHRFQRAATGRARFRGRTSSSSRGAAARSRT